MKNKLSKEDILNLAKEKGVKLSYLNSLIGGYRGKLTDWKNGKTTLTDAELDTISNYLLGNETSGTKPTDEDIKFALFDGTEGVTDEMYDELKRFARFLKFEQSEKPAIGRISEKQKLGTIEDDNTENEDAHQDAG